MKPSSFPTRLLLLVAVLAVFLPVAGFDFVNYDDDVNVYANDRILDFSISDLGYFWRQPHALLYVPLTYTVWGGLARLSTLLTNGPGPHPALFHLANLLLHGAGVLVLFAILRLLLKADANGHGAVSDFSSGPQPMADWPAAAGALLFAVHPVQVEAVAWVTGLKDVLSGFFVLLALWQYLKRHAGPEREVRPWRSWRYGRATLFFVAAMLAKPSAVITPLLAAGLGYLLLAVRPRRLAGELGPWLLLTLPVIVVAKLAQPATAESLTPALWQRLLIAGDALTFYLGTLALPLTLTADYGRSAATVLTQDWLLLSALLPFVLAALLVWKYRRPWALAAAFAFLAALLPVLGLTHFAYQDISTVADRYLYVAMLGPALALAAWLKRCQPGGAALWLGVGLALLLLAAKSAIQVRHWQDAITFNTHAVQATPKNSAAYNNLGLALKAANRQPEAIAAFQQAMNLSSRYVQLYKEQRQSPAEAAQNEQAMAQAKKAMAENPNDAAAYFTLGDSAQASGKLTEALSYYKNGVRLQPASAVGHAKLGLVYKALDNHREAIAAYLKAVELDPGFAQVYNNLGLLYEGEDKKKAITMYQKALELQPNLGEAANNLGYLYLGMGRENEAIPLFQKAIGIYPTNPLPHNNLGLAHFNLGHYAEAAACFQQAMTVEPTFAPAVNNLSRVALRLGNIQEALDYAEQAKALGFTDPAHLEALRKHRK